MQLNYNLKIHPDTYNYRQKIVLKQMKRMQRKINRFR